MTNHRGIWKKKSLSCVEGENGLLSVAWLHRLMFQGLMCPTWCRISERFEAHCGHNDDVSNIPKKELCNLLPHARTTGFLTAAHIICVSPDGTCLVSPFWCLEFWVASRVLEKILDPPVTPLKPENSCKSYLKVQLLPLRKHLHHYHRNQPQNHLDGRHPVLLPQINK
jgi:hypothetical protein